MKKLKLKGLLSLLLAFTVFTSYASPIFAAPEDENTDNETETVENTNDNDEENNIEVDNAVDVDLSSVQIGDQFNDSEGITYTVSDDAANIYVGSGSNQKHYETGSVDTFEITYRIADGDDDSDAVETWRKYIRLEDLCNLTKGDRTPICEIMDETDEEAGEFYLKRLYKEKVRNTVSEDGNSYERYISIYYKSYHTTKTKEFEAILQLVDENDEVVNTYLFDSSSGTTPSDAGKWEIIEEEDGNKTSIMATDIETLIDNNNDVYVSLRFVSESLGAEVRWVSEEDNKDGSDDAVYIEFYDDKEYCKDIEYNFISGIDNKTVVSPEEMEKSLYQKSLTKKELSLDGQYSYINNTTNEIEKFEVKWDDLYILLTVPENYPDGFFDIDSNSGEPRNVPLSERIYWGKNSSGNNVLQINGLIYGKYSDDQVTVGDITYDGNLGEEINITGIILYRGVPIAIDLFNVNTETCNSN